MLINLLAGLFFVWMILLSFFLFKTRRHYLNLISRTKKQKIDEILDKLVEDNDKLDTEIVNIKRQIKSIISGSKVYFQKVGLIRFNPFGRTGMDQSFVLALLNEARNGIVINFIYTHEGVRVYAKRVKEGRGEEHDLSDEERQAIDKA